MTKKRVFGTDNLPHQEIIAACRKGDQKAQFELYRLYYKAMYNTALRIVGDQDDAEDVMQEAFLKAFTKLHTYRGEVSFGAWMKKIVIHKSLDFIRVKKIHVGLEDTKEIMEAKEEEVPERDWAEHVGSIREALYSLPDGYRVVLSLILFEGYDHEEVSQILGISNSTSRTQYHRARKKLLERINELNKNRKNE